jgi:hypothetical protein
LPVEPASLSSNRAVKIISGMDLQSRLIGQGLESPPRFWRIELGRKAPFAGIIEADVMA